MIFFSRIWRDDRGNLSPQDRFPKVKPPKGKTKVIRLPAILPAWLPNLLPLLERWHPKPGNPFFLSSGLQTAVPETNPSTKARSIQSIWLLLVMDSVYAPLHSSGKNELAIVRRTALLPAAAKCRYSQPDSTGDGIHRECYFFGYHLYMYVASDSHSDFRYSLFWDGLPGMNAFLSAFLFSIKAYLPEFRIEKLLLDSAHDAYAVYEYCRRERSRLLST